ncbi:Peroxiredoxin [Nibea albiflora]|uniref:Peroxiredoxin n=1 Tax=Nibea albiflora TaxID=240163 RepID=A0ACB7FLH7_NIBAL|nr:Peroxiredoxin [Nibea albiflora]
MAAGKAQIGKLAPDFTAKAVMPGGQFGDLKLSDYRGKYVVFFFYPLDFTFVCPTEIIAFSDAAEEFRKIGCEVIAASVDSHFSHFAWTNTPRKQGGLGSMKIPLVSDTRRTISTDYGVLKEDEGIAYRGLFIIDDKGILRQITINDLPVGRSVEETLRLVQAFQFTDKHGEDLCIKVLREDCNTSGASKVVKWMMGCFDALEKQYCVIESYQFKFKYSEKGPQMDILRNNDVEVQVTLEDTKRASVLLIRKLFLLMQNLEALPDNLYLNMKLYYYDDITPVDYQPPGFKEGECDSLWFEGMAVHLKVGEVQTAFHALRVRVSVEQGRVERLKEGNLKQVSERAPPERQTITVGSETGLFISL